MPLNSCMACLTHQSMIARQATAAAGRPSVPPAAGGRRQGAAGGDAGEAQDAGAGAEHQGGRRQEHMEDDVRHQQRARSARLSDHTVDIAVSHRSVVSFPVAASLCKACTEHGRAAACDGDARFGHHCCSRTRLDPQEDPRLTATWKQTIKVAVSGAAGQISNHLLFMVRGCRAWLAWGRP